MIHRETKQSKNAFSFEHNPISGGSKKQEREEERKERRGRRFVVYIYIYMFIGADELRRGFDNISRGKEITQTHSLSAYL